VAIIVGSLVQGGTERQLFLFLAACDRSRWSPILYVSGELGFWEDKIRALSVPIVLLSGSPLKKLLTFRRDVIRNGAKVFFSWSSYTNVYALALLGRMDRRIGSFRASAFSDLPESGRWLWSLLSTVGTSSIICNSRETQTVLEKFVSVRGPVLHVPNAVQIIPPEDVSRFRAAWRRRLTADDDTLLVVGVGRLDAGKNFALFVDVIAQVARDRNIRGVIAGAGSVDELQCHARRLGVEDRVQFLGLVPDARELMCAADIFLLTSRHEGMPNVILEAMSVGVACVSTKVNGVMDLCDQGQAAYVCSHEPAALAAAVSTLADDSRLRLELGRRNRALMASRFGLDEVTKRLWLLCT
jgi:glycosyltransferase involved in cell wall biosynthesis